MPANASAAITLPGSRDVITEGGKEIPGDMLKNVTGANRKTVLTVGSGSYHFVIRK